MDRRILIKNLNHLFCNLNKEGKKYSEVWLSDVDFGQLYQTEKYILNVKAEHNIDSCNDEIREILQILDKKARQELQNIWSVSVYDSNDNIHCVGDDLLVYNEANAC
jgi:hypothetical protein